MNMYSKAMNQMLPMLAMAGMYPELQTPSEKKISETEILWLIEEYKLIEDKKSKLSRSERDGLQYRVKWLVNKGIIQPEQIGLQPVIQEVLIPAKGDYKVECYRTACDNKEAIYYNHSTHKHYCETCADMINKANLHDAMEMFGHELCTIVEP